MRYDAGEVITAMVTPFNEKREVDYEKVEALAYQLVNTGSEKLAPSTIIIFLKRSPFILL